MPPLPHLVMCKVCTSVSSTWLSTGTGDNLLTEVRGLSSYIGGQKMVELYITSKAWTKKV